MDKSQRSSSVNTVSPVMRRSQDLDSLDGMPSSSTAGRPSNPTDSLDRRVGYVTTYAGLLLVLILKRLLLSYFFLMHALASFVLITVSLYHSFFFLFLIFVSWFPWLLFFFQTHTQNKPRRIQEVPIHWDVLLNPRVYWLVLLPPNLLVNVSSFVHFPTFHLLFVRFDLILCLPFPLHEYRISEFLSWYCSVCFIRSLVSLFCCTKLC